MSLGNWKDATEYFSKIQKKEPHYAGSCFLRESRLHEARRLRTRAGDGRSAFE